MSYILDALTRSQKQRQRSTVPTLTTEHLSEESKHSTSHAWRGIAIGLTAATVLMALYAMRNRPFTPDALGSQPAAAAIMRSGSPASSTAPDAVPERATSLASVEPDTADVVSGHSRPRKDGVTHNRPQAPAIRARETAGHGKPVPGPSATTATSEITRVRAHSLPERRLSPESRWLVDEMLALRRDTPRGRAPSEALQDTRSPAAPVLGRDVTRRPEHLGDPPPVGTPTGSASALPTLRQLPLATQAAIPPLEVNVHAYAQTRGERMVIINMKRYREGDRLREGPLVDTITPAGVVLIFDNQRFRLTAR